MQIFILKDSKIIPVEAEQRKGHVWLEEDGCTVRDSYIDKDGLHFSTEEKAEEWREENMRRKLANEKAK